MRLPWRKKVKRARRPQRILPRTSRPQGGPRLRGYEFRLEPARLVRLRVLSAHLADTLSDDGILGVGSPK
jgi:hypothetical protein